MKSIVDNISEKLAPVYRKLNDFHVNTLLGTECNILRIRVSTADVFGETQETVTSDIVSNVIITHPYSSSVQIYDYYNDVINQVDTGAIDIWDVLPIILKVPFSGEEDESSVSVKRGDIIVELLTDEHDNKIPLIMEVTKSFGSFHVKSMIAKKFEMTLYRGILSSSIQYEVDQYLNNN